jgi:hypothetical protein
MKNCKAPNCISPAQSHGFCFRHGYLRTDAKKPQRTIKTRSDKKPTHTIDFGFDDQISMFEALWENSMDERRWIICKYTLQRIDGFRTTPLFLNCFAHILSKKNYPYFKLNPDNIRIVHPNFHKIVDQGTFDDRNIHPEWKWDEWDALVIKMKEEYRKFKLKNLLP